MIFFVFVVRSGQAWVFATGQRFTHDSAGPAWPLPRQTLMFERHES
jgi:hypothetical protein